MLGARYCFFLLELLRPWVPDPAAEGSNTASSLANTEEALVVLGLPDWGKGLGFVTSFVGNWFDSSHKALHLPILPETQKKTNILFLSIPGSRVRVLFADFYR